MEVILANLLNAYNALFLSTPQVITYKILTTTVSSRDQHYPCLTDKGITAQRGQLGNLPEVTKLINGRAQIQIWMGRLA